MQLKDMLILDKVTFDTLCLKWNYEAQIYVFFKAWRGMCMGLLDT